MSEFSKPLIERLFLFFLFQNGLAVGFVRYAQLGLIFLFLQCMVVRPDGLGLLRAYAPITL